MLSKVHTAVYVGLDGMIVDVEVDVAGRGFPTFTIVGLASKAVDEAKDRVRTAIVNAGFDMPDSRITVNLAPADVPKSGSGLDLPIAMGILAASGIIERDSLRDSLFIGELSLEGQLRRVPGIISIAIAAKEHRIKTLYVPIDNAREAAMLDGLTVYAVHRLSDIILHVNGHKLLLVQPSTDISAVPDTQHTDFAEIRGQDTVKRALEIAAAGFHNIHLKGPPGAGKTMLSRAFPGILPSLDREQVLEVSRIYSVAGLLHGAPFVTRPPYRSPHHTTSKVGLIGGGANPTPGEISLAHRGVLFLDELPEFPQSVIEALRQPLEDGSVTIARAAGSVTFPCRFLLLAASNPCPCGYLGHPVKRCGCLPGMILKYQKKLSGPLLDRIDLHVHVSPVEDKYLIEAKVSESSEVIAARIHRARERQRKRLAGVGICTNGEMNSMHIRRICRLTDQSLVLMKAAIARLSLSARSYFKIIKVAQTIADLGESEVVDAPHIAEALQYRAQDR